MKIGPWLQQHIGWSPQHSLVLSVQEASDRRLRLIKELKDHVIPAEFVIVERHPTNGAMGCLHGHLQMIRLAKERKWPSVLILEDDVTFETETSENADIPDDWDMLYLGVHALRGTDVNSHIFRLLTGLTTHAYLLHERMYDVILAQQWTQHCLEWTSIRVDPQIMLQYPLSRQYFSPLHLLHDHPQETSIDWTKRAIDIFYAHYIHPKFQCFAIRPMMAWQSPGKSFIEENVTDYNPLMRWKAVTCTWPQFTVLVLTEEPRPEFVHLIKESFEEPLIVVWLSGTERRQEIAGHLILLGSFLFLQSQVGWVDRMILTHGSSRHPSLSFLVDYSADYCGALCVLSRQWFDSTRYDHQTKEKPVMFREDWSTDDRVLSWIPNEIYQIPLTTPTTSFTHSSCLGDWLHSLLKHWRKGEIPLLDSIPNKVWSYVPPMSNRLICLHDLTSWSPSRSALFDQMRQKWAKLLE
jgi:hypothetical protein